jgi:hypothetical protein
MAVHVRSSSSTARWTALAFDRQAKIDIRDIFVSQITEQFIRIVQNAPDFDPEEASEFIAMAATLVEIKSRALLPKPPRPDEEDPEQMLIARLTAYKQFKESAEAMAAFEESAMRAFGKLPEENPSPPADAGNRRADAGRAVAGTPARGRTRSAGGSGGGSPPARHPPRQLHGGKLHEDHSAPPARRCGPLRRAVRRHARPRRES